jgi:RND superfamily putative drug exporter
VTAAALLLSVTFFAFATSGITFIKLFGLGLAIAVLVDATIVRATLVPALMKLAGRANWWAPSFLTGLYRRAGLSEAAAEAAADAVSVDAPVTVDLVPVLDDPGLGGTSASDERTPAVVRR